METIQPKDKNKALEETFQKIKFILSRAEAAEDYLYKYQLKTLFILKEDSFEFAFKNGSNIEELIIKLVDILHLVFEMPRNKRQEFYNLNLLDIIKDNKLREKIIELDRLQSFNIDFDKENKKEMKLVNLFKIISFALDQKKSYTFGEYIDSIFVNLSFLPGLETLLKYQFYLKLHTYYLNPINVTLDFSENEINTSDDTPLDLITEIFTKNQNDVECVIKSLIFLNYGSLKNIIIKNYTIDEILSVIDVICHKFKNIKNIVKLSLCVEKIMTMFVDELKRLKDKKKRNERGVSQRS